MAEFSKYLPEGVLCLAGLAILMAGATGRLKAPRAVLSWASLGALLACASLLDPAGAPFAFYSRFIVAAVGALIVCAYWNDVDDESPGEFLSSVLFSLAGAMLMVSADDLIVLFIGLELVSLPTYLLISLGRKHIEAQEAGNKYFFLSILAAAILLYGFSFVYGVTGTLRLSPTDSAAVRGAVVNVYEAERALEEVTTRAAALEPLAVGAKPGFDAASVRKLSAEDKALAKEKLVRQMRAPAEEILRKAEAELARVGDDVPTRVFLLMREVRSGNRGGLAMLVFGGVLAVVGVCFKLAAVPFHFYAPDVYQGAHHAVAGMLAFVPKAAGVTAVFKFVLPAFGPLVSPSLISGGAAQTVGGAWFGLFWFLAITSMTVGNVLALMQTNVKRMLAYSSIAHSGYILVGVVSVLADPGSPAESAINRNGAAAALFYILVYGVMTLGAFAALCLVQTSAGEPAESLDDLSGLSKRRPAAALAIAVFMFSLTGLPPTAGFLGKLTLFSSALATPDAGTATVAAGPHYWLVILGVLNSAVSAYYYLGVVSSMYLREPVGQVELSRSTPLRFVVAVCAALTLAWGVFPRWPMSKSVAAADELDRTNILQVRPNRTAPAAEAKDR